MSITQTSIPSNGEEDIWIKPWRGRYMDKAMGAAANW